LTEFFSKYRNRGVPSDDSGFDTGRQGVVYRFSLRDNAAAAPITIAPVANTGFQDSNGANTGCFPNQLYAATINRNRLYVTSVCESPRGPTGPVVMGTMTDTRNFKTEVHAAVFVVDTATNAEIPAQAAVLTQRFQALYDGAMTPDDGASRRMPLVPNDIAFVPMSSVAYVSSYGSDAVFRIRYADDGAIMEVGSSANRFINLSATTPPGRLPVGIAVGNRATNFALTINENSRNLSILAFMTQSAIAAVPSAEPPAGGRDTEVNDGRRFFVTGLGRWSLKGQGWNSCESCHPDGLTDNVTWFFARGPRQTTSLDGTYSPDGQTRRLLNWTAIFDELQDFELNTRGNSGGVGAVVHANSMPPAASDRIIFDGTAPVAPQMPTATPQAGLNGSITSISSPMGSGTPRSVLDDFDRMDRFVRTIRAPRAPVGLAAADVMAGRMLFTENNCNGCHSGASWTISRVFYTPNEANNNPATGALRMRTYMLPAMFPAQLNPPARTAAAPLRFANTDPMVVAANDQINCALRAVGTFPATPDAMMTGVAPTGVRVREVRTNMMTLAQGATGFNPPSLVGMATGAPYFHAGNARTLEELFADTFSAHHTALSANFLATGDRATQVRQLVAFLLSIDDDAMTVGPMGALPFNPDLCGSL
jgi:hypothetical protein